MDRNNSGNRDSRGRHGGQRRSWDRGPREMHDAVCADCKEKCQVPFKPNNEKPIYCKECYKKRNGF